MSTPRQTRYARDVKRYWGLPVPPHLQHGNATRAASVYGCPCSVCLPSGRRRQVFEDRTLTRNERTRRHRANKRNQPVPPDQLHGDYAYRTYNCRCDICRKAKQRLNHLRTWGWLTRARGRYVFYPDKTIIHWPPADAPSDWTCPDCGVRPLEGVAS